MYMTLIQICKLRKCSGEKSGAVNIYKYDPYQ